PGDGRHRGGREQIPPRIPVSSRAAAGGAVSADPPLILIVDDDEDVREIVSMVLEASGYDTITAGDRRAALQALRAGSNPALIPPALRMRRLRGEELMRELRVSPTFARIPVVVMSANHGAPVANAIGARRYLQKPVDIDELVRTVTNLAPP